MDLTDDQEQQVKTLFTELKKEKSDIDKSDMSEKAKKDSKRELREKMKSGLNEILTAEQKAKLKQMKESKRMHKQRSRVAE